ncbi:MAG: MFS transporter [Burkholderiaceae bacterium]
MMPNSRQCHADAPLERPETGQFALLRQRRFAPFFWTQFLGAANDNLFKFALTVMVTYQLQLAWLPPAKAGLVIGALFIAPFMLLSATSGQLADKFDKARLIRALKTSEILIMALAAIGLVFAQIPLLLGCIFLMGAQSAVFGPLKYAYLPQHLDEHEITGGNGMVEMGTFVAILLGNVAGGLLIAIPELGPLWVALGCLALAVLGRITAARVPESPSLAADLRINPNPLSETWRNLRLAHADKTVFRSLLGISWMWCFGAIFLAQFPVFAREVLGGNEQVASLLLVLFSVGIGAGSLACETLSRRQVEIGLVPLGAIGMTVFAVDLWLGTRATDMAAGSLSIGEFISHAAHWRVMADLILLSFFTGLYSVPMYALIQTRSQPTHRARIIAANNILNAALMVLSSLGAGMLLSAGLSVPELFLVAGLLNAVVALVIFTLVPEYLLRFICWVAASMIYRCRISGAGRIPASGPALLIANHVSFVDAILLMAASPRPVRFLMDHRIFAQPVLGALFKLAKAIPIAPRDENPECYRTAMDQAQRVLRDGDLLAIFPEGAITRNGELGEFRAGALRILADAAGQGVKVPVVPVGLNGLWGSFFSRIEQGRAMVAPLRRGLRNSIHIHVGEALDAAISSTDDLRNAVIRLLEPSAAPVRARRHRV